MRRQPRLRPVEKELARRLSDVYRIMPENDSDMRAWNAHAENVERDLPWRQDYQRAVYLQDVAIRYTYLRRAKR